jgi:hypothetical protein
MHEQTEEEQKVDELGRLKLGDDMADKLRHELGYRRADGVDKLGESKASLLISTASTLCCLTYRIPNNPLRFHDIQRLEKRLGHLLERWLVRQHLELRVGDLGKPLCEVAEREEVVMDLKYRKEILRC